MNRAIEAGTSFGIDQRFVVNNLVLTAQGEQKAHKKRATNGVAKHEADHVIAAIYNGTSVESVTIVPGPGYLGLTKLSRADPVAAAGPYSQGGEEARGIWSDEWSIEAAGYSVGAMASIAGGIISAHEDEKEAVAIALEEEKTLGSNGISKAMHEAKVEKFETATVFVQSDEGKSAEISGVEVRDNIVMMPDVWYKLAESTNNPQIH